MKNFLKVGNKPKNIHSFFDRTQIKILNFFYSIFHSKTLLYKKGKCYKIVENQGTCWIMNSEMTSEQVFPKKDLEKYFYTEKQIRTRKLRILKKRNGKDSV